MPRYSLVLCLFSLSAFFITRPVAREVIVGGDLARIDDFPYQVSLMLRKKNFCGGGIIGEKFIITAAHCVIRENGQFTSKKLTILAGTNSLNNVNVTALNVEIKRFYVPAEFNRNSNPAVADIAILKLRQPLKLSSSNAINLKKLKLPANERESFAGRTAMIAGFGWDWIELNSTARSGDNSDSRLRFAEADVLSNNECLFGQPPKQVPDQQLCARVKQYDGSKWRGVCTGDSGSPLVDDYRTVIGILSNGPRGCTERERPAIYTRVSNYLTFIHNVKDGKKSKHIQEFEPPN